MKKLLTLLFLCSTSMVFSMDPQEATELNALANMRHVLDIAKKTKYDIEKWEASRYCKIDDFDRFVFTIQLRMEQIIEKLEPKEEGKKN